MRDKKKVNFVSELRRQTFLMSKTSICISLMLCIAQQDLLQSKQRQHLFTFLHANIFLLSL